MNYDNRKETDPTDKEYCRHGYYHAEDCLDCVLGRIANRTLEMFNDMLSYVAERDKEERK